MSTHTMMPTDVTIPARILGTGTVLPGRAYTTAEITEHVGGTRSAEAWEARTGIHTRHWAEPGTLIAPLAAEAIAKALVAAGLVATDLRRIILTFSGTGDVSMPATANKVAAWLGLRGSCDAFDVKNACMGFLTAFDLAARSVATGLGPVAVVSAELISRGIQRSDPRPYMVFGDAVSAAIIGRGRTDEGVIATALGNDGSHPDDVVVYEPVLTGKIEYVHFAKPSAELYDIAFGALRRGVNEVLSAAGVGLDAIEWVLPHQPNGQMLDAMIAGLGLDPARIVKIVHRVGGVTSASIPVSLDELLRTRPVKPGDRVLMAGVGAGISYGATLYRFGTELSS